MSEEKDCPTRSGIAMPAPKEAMGWLATGDVVTPSGPNCRTAPPPVQTTGAKPARSMSMGAAT